MASTPPDVHKRSKSGVARSFLQRATSHGGRHNLKDENSTSSKSDVDTGSPLAKTTTTSTQSTEATSPDVDQTSSIERSVKLFRLYEALRKGDNTSVSSAIKEATDLSGAHHSSVSLEGTSLLHLAIQCADSSVIEYILANAGGRLDINARDKDGNTPLHVAADLSRAPVIRLLLDSKGVNDSVLNYNGKTALDLAKSPEVFQQLQLAKSFYIDSRVKEVQGLVSKGDYKHLENLLGDTHFQNALDINGPELATDPETARYGGSLLHEASRKKDAKLIQILLLNGADPFQRDRKGKLPQDVTKDDKTRSILKKSPAAAAAQRGIQEKTILGSGSSQGAAAGPTGEGAIGTKESREMRGYLKKWTNYTSGYKLRWFVLEDGVLSYYKHQDDAGSACRGAINMKIAKLHMDTQDKVQFEILGKSSVKYHLKANHQVEAKRWVWALNNAIQWAKDEAKEEQKRTARSAEIMRQARTGIAERTTAKESDRTNISNSKPGHRLVPATAIGISRTLTDDEDAATSVADTSVAGDDITKPSRSNDTPAIEGDLDDDEEYGDDASSVEAKPVNRDAFMIAAHSAGLQLDLLTQITEALYSERSKNAEMLISDPVVIQALTSYEAAIANLKGLVGDLGRIARDREAYWHYRLEQEINVRRIWEDSMARVAKEQEELESRIGESEEKRRRTKRALRDALEGQSPSPAAASPGIQIQEPSRPTSSADAKDSSSTYRSRTGSGPRKRSTITEMTTISDSESDDDEEFFDAVDEGKVEVVEEMPPSTLQSQQPGKAVDSDSQELRTEKHEDIKPSFKGYEEPIRTRLRMDADNRPKISLWGILKSMIGKDMTKMTLPVSFNEPTSLLQRVAEDMEYTDLLDIAADRADSTERMLYVAAFAASEYASTIGRVAKPFNPLLGETYEYARPDKGFRFFVEQVSHHPPIGAAWAESPKWEYYGESAVKSKFYGKSFDINPLGTWFLKLRPSSNANGQKVKEELFTWKKVTSSVIGIITGAPTVDNYGPMEIKNHTTGEVCLLDFKPRGWKASSAYQVQGRVLDRSGAPRWSLGGRWNDKIYARLTPGFEDLIEGPLTKARDGHQAFLVWEAHSRPSNVPFNLTPFVITLNALTDSLRPWLPPTDTRLRPDQKAMEDGEYDTAATEKNRVEEKQRAKRRERETIGEDFVPQWYEKSICKITGEQFWDVRRASDGGVQYWQSRDKKEWTICEDIF